MPSEFDPYHRWLGIPPKHQPADHYRLLGLERFEDDPEVIRDAAERQMVHVRSYQLGKFSDLSQKVLNRLGAARACLLNEQRKAEYDRGLREELAEKDSRPRVRSEPRGLSPRRGAGINPAARTLVLGGTAAALLVALLAVFAIQRGNEEPRKKEPSPVAKRNRTKKNTPEGKQKAAKREPSALAAGAKLTNSIGMELVLIPAGEFIMGSPESEEGREADEKQHRVRITKPFYLSAREVTQGQYERVTGKTPSRFKGPTLPVESVSWEDAVEFCRKLSAKEGRAYRLPTEAEWEYACRAGTTAAYCFGDDADSLGQYAWFSENADDKTHPVGTKRPNAFGLDDMHGNVWEWCGDWYDGSYYAKSPEDDPTGPSTCSLRVYRGGSWLNISGYCRSANRSGDSPDFRYGNLGFRVHTAGAGEAASDGTP